MADAAQAARDAIARLAMVSRCAKDYRAGWRFLTGEHLAPLTESAFQAALVNLGRYRRQLFTALDNQECGEAKDG